MQSLSKLVLPYVFHSEENLFMIIILWHCSVFLKDKKKKV